MWCRIKRKTRIGNLISERYRNLAFELQLETEETSPITKHFCLV